LGRKGRRRKKKKLNDEQLMKFRIKKMVQRHRRVISNHRNRKKFKMKKRTQSLEAVPMTSIDIAKKVIETR